MMCRAKQYKQKPTTTSNRLDNAPWAMGHGARKLPTATLQLAGLVALAIKKNKKKNAVKQMAKCSQGNASTCCGFGWKQLIPMTHRRAAGAGKWHNAQKRWE